MRKTALYRGFSIPKILFIVLSWSAEEVRTALGAWLTLDWSAEEVRTAPGAWLTLPWSAE